MTKKSIGYPFQYGDELTPEMASNNRKQAVSYSVLIPSIWWHNLGFAEPIQSYSSCLNESKMPIVQIVETSRVNSINRGGDLGKSGPGPRAKADALKNARKTGGGSIFVHGFTPQRQYGSRPINAQPLSCRNNVKINQDQFNGNGGDNQPPPESSQFDASKYKGGPSPFEEYEYKDPAVVAQNIGFNQPNRLNKSYDKHAEDCFGIVENRNKENLEIFKGDITNLAQSADEVYKGSYRYEDPAYIFLKEINEKMTAVIVNATDGEYITSINPTSGQMEDLQSNGNIGLDTRQSMQLTLRLRGPKNSNL